jgi:hypothetical protein
MDPVTLLLLALGVSIAAIAVSSQSGKPSGVTPPPAGGRSPVRAMRWYRLAVAAPTPATAVGVSAAAAAQGFVPKAEWSRDVTTYGRPAWVTLGYCTMDHPAGFVDGGGYQFLSWQEVAPPPDGVITSTYDPGMPALTQDAVTTALAMETDPSKLLSFADSLLPEYPIAAGLLKTKANLLSASQTLPAPTRAVVAAGCECPSAETGGFFDDLGRTLSHVTRDVSRSVTHVVHDVDKAIQSVPVLRDVMNADPVSFLIHEASSGRPLSALVGDYGKAIKNVAPIVESVVAVVPGVGPEVASGIAFGCSLAEGKPISQAGLDAACAMIPGGAFVQGAAKAAAHMGAALLNGQALDKAALSGVSTLGDFVPGGALGKAAFQTGLSVLQGKRVDDAALSAIREKLPGGAAAQAAFDVATGIAKGQKPASAFLGGLEKLRAMVPGGAAGLAAFDTATAIAHGKNLQDAGFGAARSLLPGGPAQQVAGFLQHVSQNPKDVQGAVESALRDELGKLGHGAFESVHKAVGRMVATPALAHLPVLDLAKKLDVAEAVARAALACVHVPKPTPGAAKAVGPAHVAAATKVLSNLIVVHPARLAKFAAPPAPNSVQSASLKYARQRGAKNAAQDAAKIFRGAAQADIKSRAKANDLGNAARLLARGQHIAHYLALKASRAKTRAAA